MLTLSPLPPPRLVLGWPRWVRVLVGVGLTIATLAAVPFLLLLVKSGVGLDSCGDASIAPTIWICSAPGRVLIMIATMGVGLYPMIYWCRLLQGLISRAESFPRTPPVVTGSVPGSNAAPSRVKHLKFGQVIVVGAISRSEDSRFQVRVADRSFALLNLSAFASGSLRNGDVVQFVVQKLPLISSAELGLAYRTKRSGGVRGVSGATNVWAVLTAVVALAYSISIDSRSGFILSVVAMGVLVLNLAFLILTVRAARALKLEAND